VVLARRVYKTRSGRPDAENPFAVWETKSLPGTAGIPMGALVSPDMSNALAAGRCIAADPGLIDTFRLMSTCMALGEAAGIMAALCWEAGGDVRKLRYERLRPELERAGFPLNG